MNASKPLSAMLVNGTTSTVLLSSKSPTAMLQSKGIVISLPPISNTIAGALNDSMYIKGIKKKSGSLGLLLSNTLKAMSSDTVSGNLFKSYARLSTVSILINSLQNYYLLYQNKNILCLCLEPCIYFLMVNVFLM